MLRFRLEFDEDYMGGYENKKATQKVMRRTIKGLKNIHYAISQWQQDYENQSENSDARYMTEQERIGLSELRYELLEAMDKYISDDSHNFVYALGIYEEEKENA